MRPTRILRRLATSVAWVAIALLIAFGAAGVVAATQHLPGTPARAELTWAADRDVAPALDAATTELETLSGTVDDLAGAARDALARLGEGDESALQDAIAQGTTTLLSVQDQAATLDGMLAAVPHRGDAWELLVAADLRHRYDELASAPGLAAGLETQWASFTGQALDAAKLARLLSRHDEETAAAAAAGTAGRYQEALNLLDAPDATIAEARTLAGRLAARADTSTLTQWLDLNADYDRALRNLYSTILAAGGTATDEVRAAYEGEAAARARLPGDTRAIVVIMSDVAQGGLNQAAISIEEARGELSAELDVQRQLQEGPALPD